MPARLIYRQTDIYCTLFQDNLGKLAPEKLSHSGS